MFRHADGSIAENRMGVSCPAGGFGAGLCFDNPDAKALGGKFLRALAQHYKGHPALLGYDVWNETNYPPGRMLTAKHTKAAFRDWLKARLRLAGSSWGGRGAANSFTDWNQVMPPQTIDFLRRIH
jgi:beta-galactosidase